MIKNQTIDNQMEINKKIHFFSARFANFFIEKCIKYKISANFISYLMLLFGYLSFLIIFIEKNFLIFLVSYLFFRIHIFLDFCDGKIAVATKTFTKAIEYYDKFSHIIIALFFSYLIFYDSINKLIIFPLFSIMIFHYFKFKKKNKSFEFRNQVFLSKNISIQTFVTNLFNIEGFLFFNLVVMLINHDDLNFLFNHYYFIIFSMYHLSVPIIKKIYK